MVTELELSQRSEAGIYLRGTEQAAEVLGRYAATISCVYCKPGFDPYLHGERGFLFQDRPLLSLQWDDPIDLISFWPDHWGEVGQYETVFSLKDISLGERDSVVLSVSVPSSSNMAIFLKYIQMEQEEKGISVGRHARKFLPKGMGERNEQVRFTNVFKSNTTLDGVYVFEFGGGENKISGYVFWEDQEEGSESFDFRIVLPDEDFDMMNKSLLLELRDERRSKAGR